MDNPYSEGAVFHVMCKSVSDELLNEMGVEFGGADLVTPESALATRTISWEGVQRLKARGYTTTNIFDLETEGHYFVALLGPDGRSPIRAGTDPATIKLVESADWVGSTAMLSYVKGLASEILCPAIGKHVKLSGRGGNCNLPIDAWAAPDDYADLSPGQRAAADEEHRKAEEYLHVHLASSPVGGSLETGSTAWGIEAGRMSISVGVWLGADHHIVSPEGDAFGAMDGRNLYVYHNLVYDENPGNKEVLKKIFEAAVELWRGERKIDYDRVRRSYTKACMGRRKYEREELTDVMRQAQTSAQKWQRELKDAVRRYDEASRKLEQQDGDDERFAEMLNAEFDAIIEEDNKVVSMDCLGDNILVETENLYCIDPRSGHEHDIGAFRFVIEQEKASVKFYNMTRRVRGYNNRLMHAPHVFTNGNPCLGDQSVDIPQFVARFQWRALIDRCVRYL